MKARRFIFRVLLLALLLSPSGIRAFGSRLSAPSCRIPTRHLHGGHSKAQAEVQHHLAVALPSRHSPTTRLHRNRGKKLNIQRDFAAAPLLSVRNGHLFAGVIDCQQELAGPNPSRGPPSHLLL